MEKTNRILAKFLLSAVFFAASGQMFYASGQTADTAPAITGSNTAVVWVDQSIPKPDSDGWITLFDGEHLYGCNPTNQIFSSGKVFIQNRALWVDNTWLGFSWQATNVAFRARLKKVSGHGVHLNIGPCLGWFDGGNNFGIGQSRKGAYSALGDGKSARAFGDFFDMEMRLAGGKISLLADGATVVAAQGNPPNGLAAVSMMAEKGITTFSKIEVRILKEPFPNDPGKDDGLSKLKTVAKPGAAERLKQLKSILDQGLINQEDYDKKAKQIMDSMLRFGDDGRGNFIFDTGVVKGSLKKDGLGEGLKPIQFIEPNVPIDNAAHGLLVPYRFLTPQKRYGVGSWEWPRTGKLLDDGGAELHWAASTNRPFTFSSTWRWRATDTVDLTLRFTPDTDLEKFELFLGSYMRGFTSAKAYVQDAGNGQPGFLAASKDNGGMQLFPRGQDVLAVINDGRWTFPPAPNNWSIRPRLAAPLGFRREPVSGVTVLIMAPPEDCFAVSMSQQEGPLGAFYLSLFGKDVNKGQTLIGHARMIFGQNMTEEQAVQKYQQYLTEIAHNGMAVGIPTSPAGNPAKPDATERLKKVKALYDQGLITKEDYDKKVQEITDSL